MDRIEATNAERIDWCCRQFGISPHELASIVGISTKTIDKAMAGEAALTFGQLKRIADYFGRGVLFFLEQEAVEEQNVFTPQFRTLTNQKPFISQKIRLLIQRAEQQRNVYLSLREDLGDEDRPRFTPPERVPNDPRAAAAVARRWLNLANQNTFDAYRAAVEARGILVFRSNGYNGKWQIPKESPIIGFNLYYADCPLIVVKKAAAETRQTFTLMHELGHILMHRASWIDEESDLYSHQGNEHVANAFAGHLLVPNELLRLVAVNDRPGHVSEYDNWLEPYRTAWGVSGEVILRRLLDEGRLPQASYDEYRTWHSNNVRVEDDGGNRAYRHREPMHVFGDTYVRTVLDALDAQHISLSKASNYLDSLRIRDLHLLEQYYANH
jgi:Zn-dependent peptidase ImmA (M78 family)/plasmid maintenance system antidote protein VapI